MSETPPRQWPLIWARDEAFWRDVASRSVSGSIVVALGYVAAVLLGYLALPPVRAVVIGVIAFVAFIAYINMLSFFLLRYTKKLDGLPPSWRVSARANLGLLLYLLLMVGGMLATVAVAGFFIRLGEVG